MGRFSRFVFTTTGSLRDAMAAADAIVANRMMREMVKDLLVIVW